MTEQQIMRLLAKRLETEYRDTQSAVKDKIAVLSGSFEKTNKLYQQQVKDGVITKEAYRKWYKQQVTTAKWCNDMIAELSTDVTNANLKAYEIINQNTSEVYIGGALEGGKEIGKYPNFDLVDRKQAEKLLKDNNDLLPKAKLNIPKDQKWNERRMRSAVLQSALKGESITKLSKRLEYVVGMNKTSAVRNARTMMTASHNMGKLDVGREAQEMGIDVRKKWLATFDNRTRDSHALLHGEIVDIDEEFSNGLMFPADPDGDPSEVYNCRCTFRYTHEQKQDGMSREEFDERVDEVAEKKEAWRNGEEYVPKEQPVKEVPTKAETKQEFIPAQTKEEAEQYISQYVDKTQFGALGVDCTGIDLDVANEINRTLGDLYGTFDNGKFGGIKAPTGNSREGKLISGATAGYSPIRNSYYLNRSSLKNMKTAEKMFATETETIKNLLEHPEKYDFTKASKSLITVVENSKVSGRATIPTTIEQVMQHEFGHSLEKKVMKHELWEQAKGNIDKYAPQLSGYACTNTDEYIAESFCSYMQGEGKADPTLVKIFNSLRRQQ